MKLETKTLDVNAILEDDVVKLVPFVLKDDIETVLNLVMKCKYTRFSREQARNALLKTPGTFWHCYIKKTGDLGGIAYVTRPAGRHWTLDAYKDDALLKDIDNTMDYSYRVGKLVLDFALQFTNTIVTAHAFENRGATIVCKKLGFKEDFIFMRKDR